MTKKKKIIICAAVAVAIIAGVVAFLCLRGGDERFVFEGGSEKTAPIEKVLESIISHNGDLYYSAFPPELKTAYDDLYVIQGTFPGCEDASDYLKNCVDSINEQNYGKDYRLTAEVISEKKASVEELEEMSVDINWDKNTGLSFVTEENTEAVYSVKLKLNYEGELDSEKKDVELYVVNQEGKWYLHPFYIFYGF